jgi:hypothetical protein
MMTVLALIVFDTITLGPACVDRSLERLTSFWVARDVHVWPPLVMGAEMLIAAGLAFAVTRLKQTAAWTPALNLFACILLALPIASIVRSRPLPPVVTTDTADHKGDPPPAVATAHVVDGHRPDVYYIIMDGYARSDVMSELFGFDNEPFLQRLEQKGFFVARRSTANYCQTPLALSSSLNVTYLNGLIPADWESSAALNKWTGDGAVALTFKQLGYRLVSFSSGFAETEHPETEFYMTPSEYLSPFHRMLVDRTPLAPLAPIPALFDSYTSSRARTLHVFEKLPVVARWGAPTFAFAHILSPHPPFLFGRAGEDVSPRNQTYLLTDGEIFRKWYGDREDYVAGYRAQAAFLTDRVEQMIDQILANSHEPPVIILQSDHGSGMGLSTESIEETDLHERMSILNAYYLPGAPKHALYQSISPVNSFRVVLNTYFDAGLELLPDRSYYSTWSKPFDFIDVTAKVRPPSDLGPISACEPGPAPDR